MSAQPYLLALSVFACTSATSTEGDAPQGPALEHDGPAISLPAPQTDGATSLEAALAQRRSVRAFRDDPLSLEHISQLLWATQGITENARGLRTAPSAGALYPLEVDLVVVGTEGLDDGVYRYLPRSHELQPRLRGDARPAVHASSLQQDAILRAPALVVLWGVSSRTAARYGRRAPRYVQMEAGHAAQNTLLQATTLGLGGVPVGAFDDRAIQKALAVEPEESPQYVLPIGHLPSAD